MTRNATIIVKFWYILYLVLCNIYPDFWEPGKLFARDML